MPALRSVLRAASCLLFVSLLAVATARAGTPPPGTVTGVVRDGTGAVIVRASVTLLTGEQTAARSTRTGEDGRFRFDKVPQGRYLLLVSFPGFADRRVAVMAGEGAARDVEVVLEPTPVEAEVTVTATVGAVQDRQAVPQQINVIESTEIAERAKAVVAQAVVEEAGVNIVRTSPTMAGIYVRGLTGNKVNVFVDGVRYSNSAARGGVNTFLDLIEPSSLQAIEVLRGPNSAQYGSDALGGSVQFLSQVPSLTSSDRTVWNGSYALRGNSADSSLGGTLAAGYSARAFGMFVSAAGRRINDIRPGRGIDSHAAPTRFFGISSDAVMPSHLPETSFTQYGGMAKGNWTPTPSDQVLVSYSRNQQDGGKRYDQLLGGDGNLIADLRNLMLDFFYVKYNRADVGPFDQVTATYSLNSQREERVNQGGNGNPRNAITHEFERTTAQGVQLKATARPSARQELLVGGEMYPEHVKAPSVSFNPVTGMTSIRRGRVPDGATYRSLGAYVQDAVELVPNKVRALGGLRYSSARYRAYAADSPLVNGKPLWPDDALDTSSVTFRAGVVALPTERFTMSANVSRGFRAPHITDLGTLGLTGSGFTVSAKEIGVAGATVGSTAGANAVSTGLPVTSAGPETSLEYEGSVGYHGRRLSTTASFFLNTVYDNIVYQALIMPPGSVGSLLGDQPITAQSPTGVVYVPASSSPVLVRTNYGDARITGFEHTLELRVTPTVSLGTTLTLLHAKDLATGLPPNIEGGTPGPDFYVKVRYAPATGRYWIEPIVHAVGRQDRLSSLDLEDRRTGASRTRGNIKNFFYNGATVRGWVGPGADGVPGNADDILQATGETLAQIQQRVLGTADSAPLYTAVAGYVTLAVRGGFRIGARQELLFEVENATDRNYRGIAWGMDASGVGVSVVYTTRF
jgi:outer membrane receptor protein involved in Fe transport